MTIAMLSWGADKTLENTLKSYRYHNLITTDLDRIILLQEGTREQQMMSAYYGFRPILLPYNIGIAQGYNALLQQAKGEYFLFLENDWELLEDPRLQFETARYMRAKHNIDVFRFRSRQRPGNPLWTRQFEGRELDRPTHLLDSVHWKPHYLLNVDYVEAYEYNGIGAVMDDIDPYTRVTVPWYYTSSKYANWTNNPHMARTDFLRQHIAPRLGTGDLEKDIQSWWEQQDFQVAQSDGLFTHNRLD